MSYEPKHFKWSEFDQKGLPGSGERHMCKRFVVLLDELRERVGFPLVVVSGYRSPAYNARVSKTGLTGPHTTGKAVDIRASGKQAYALTKAAFELGFTGIGVRQSGEHAARVIHLDMLKDGENGAPRPWVWTY